MLGRRTRSALGRRQLRGLPDLATELIFDQVRRVGLTGRGFRAHHLALRTCRAGDRVRLDNVAVRIAGKVLIRGDVGRADGAIPIRRARIRDHRFLARPVSDHPFFGELRLERGLGRRDVAPVRHERGLPLGRPLDHLQILRRIGHVQAPERPRILAQGVQGIGGALRLRWRRGGHLRHWRAIGRARRGPGLRLRWRRAAGLKGGEGLRHHLRIGLIGGLHTLRGHERRGDAGDAGEWGDPRRLVEAPAALRLLHLHGGERVLLLDLGELLLAQELGIVGRIDPRGRLGDQARGGVWHLSYIPGWCRGPGTAPWAALPGSAARVDSADYWDPRAWRACS